jgi:site-specific recombinase XerD
VNGTTQSYGQLFEVTRHTLRHTAATWLRQATGDARLVAEYLGHAALSTVSRYAHVAEPELQAAAERIAAQVDWKSDDERR